MRVLSDHNCDKCGQFGVTISYEYEDVGFDFCQFCWPHDDDSMVKVNAAVSAYKAKKALAEIRDDSLGKFLEKTTAKGLAQQIRKDNDN